MNTESFKQNLIRFKRCPKEAASGYYLYYILGQPFISNEWILCDIIYYDYNFRSVSLSASLYST